MKKNVNIIKLLIMKIIFLENYVKIIGKFVSRIIKRKGNLVYNEDKRIFSKVKYI